MGKTSASSSAQALSVDVLHPDFGLGGAEALMRDVVLALEASGAKVRVFTSHYDKNRCFAETKDMEVHVYGSAVPRHILQKFHIVFATARAAVCAFRTVFSRGGSSRKADVYVCDQISAYVLFLRFFTRTPILFYCHFPDRLLVQNNAGGLVGKLKSLYRIPFDAFEEFTTGLSDKIVVNSNFTRGVFKGAFKKLDRAGVVPEVLYPVCNAAQGQYDPNICLSDKVLATLLATKDISNPTFLSINRFEKKKNIAVAIEALKRLRDLVDADSSQAALRSRHVRLVIAGGYDTKLLENVEYHDMLYELGTGYGFRCYSPIRDGGSAGDFDEYGVPKAAPDDADIIFVPSFTDAQRSCLLAGCLAVLYTPDREHFGIVPLECMAAARPVLAVKSGGPMETVVHGETGFLCPPDAPEVSANGDAKKSKLADTMAKHMQSLLDDPDRAREMGLTGRTRVLNEFSFASFQEALHQHVTRLHGAAKDGSLGKNRRGSGAVCICATLFLVLFIGAVAIVSALLGFLW